jgi:sialate O-acetylesterase
MRTKLFFVTILLVLTSVWANASVTMPHVFSDHMVIQQEKPVFVWGWADPDESVTVEFKGNRKTTQSDSKGAWAVELPAIKASAESATMTITGSNTIVINDILVGEVWICSGQSNMEWGLGNVEKGAEETAKADLPNIRLLHITSKPSPRPLSDIENTWDSCKPTTAGDFTGVGYFFGKYLYDELSVPIGLIEAAWGGTRIEPWTPREGFSQVPALKDVVTFIEQSDLRYREAMPSKITEIEDWIVKTQKAIAADKPLPDLPQWPAHEIYSEGHPTQPTCLYNSRISPIVPFSVRGAIWYQGESNMGEGMLYYEKMRALIAGWRTVFKQADLSFYYVQLAPFTYNTNTLPEIWEAQTATLEIPYTGMAVTNDIVGNVSDIHPRNKRDVGKRLALWALAKNYGKSGIVYSGPLYKSMEIKGNKIEILFDHVGSGLTTQDGKAPDLFEIAGSDNVFHAAKAKIVDDKVVVWSEKVGEPKAVRFAWSEIAQPNLMNKDGLPASSFRTNKP